MSFLTPATSKTKEQFPLSPKKVIKKTLSGVLIFSILLILIYIFAAIFLHYLLPRSSTFLPITLVFVLLIGSIFLVEYIYQKWYLTVYFYDLTDHFIVIRKGVFTPKEINVPYERVQDIYVDQDILDRIFGLYDVHISSATISSGIAAHIDGVEKPAADGLKELLLKTVQAKIKKSPSPTPHQQNEPAPTS